MLHTVAVLALVTVCPSQARPQEEMFGVERRLAFELSIRQVYDEQSQPRMIVTTSIPYSRLVFLLKDSRYISSYRVFMELRPEKGGRVRGEVWEEFIQVETYEETQSRSSLSRSKRDFDIEPGEYRVKVTLEIIDTSLRFEQEKKIRIVGRDQGELVLSDPVFMLPVRAASAQKPPLGELSVAACERIDERSFIVIPGAVYHGFDLWARVSLSLVGPFAGLSPDVAVRIRDVRGNTLLYHHKRVESGGRNHLQICTDFSVEGLTLGEYTIEASATIPGLEGRAETGGGFVVLFTRSSFMSGFEDTIEILSVIADSDDLRELESAPPAERFDAWERFWKKRDPTPSTGENESLDEFLSRLGYVMKYFSRFRPGWQTDRGKIYLEFGKPDKIADYPGHLGRSYQYWYYYSLGTIFVFEDPVGTGEYQLMSTEIM
jgi:GWxTD domain-containing protein